MGTVHLIIGLFCGSLKLSTLTIGKSNSKAPEKYLSHVCVKLFPFFLSANSLDSIYKYSIRNKLQKYSIMYYQKNILLSLQHIHNYIYIIMNYYINHANVYMIAPLMPIHVKLNVNLSYVKNNPNHVEGHLV